MWGTEKTELTVREHIKTQNELVVVDLTDDTDGPVTRIQKFMYPDQAEANYPIGRRFTLEPINE